MIRRSLVVAASPALAPDSPVVRAILDHWPGDEPPPGARCVTLAALADELEAARSRPGPGRRDAVLVRLDTGARTGEVLRLADLLERTAAPALVLSGDDGEIARLRGGGLLVERADAPPAFLAHLLYALAHRQPVIDALARDLRLAMSLQSGVRGEMDRLHDELNLAAHVQRELLPRDLPRLHGVEFGVLFRPAGYVSGDLYDLIRLDDHRVAFFIADAVGHGVPAALLTMIISRSLHPLEHGPGGPRPVPPGVVVARLNAELVRWQRETVRFATAIYGVLDARTMEVRLACAGHPPPLRLADGRAEPVPTDGPLLGVFPDATFPETTLRLAPGQTLLLYSDGFEVAFPKPQHADARADQRAHLAHLARLNPADGHGRASLPAALAELGNAIDRQSGSLHQQDDLTAVAIAVLPAAGPAGASPPGERVAA